MYVFETDINRNKLNNFLFKIKISVTGYTNMLR